MIPAPFQTVKKASQSFLRKQKIEPKNILCRGVYLTQNTYQAASVEFVRQKRTNYARGRLQKNWRKAPKGIFDKLKGTSFEVPFRLSKKLRRIFRGSGKQS